MGGKSGAERRAEDAARSSERSRQLLEDQTKILKARTDKEARKAQRLLMRSSRAAGGGFFESDSVKADQSSLGGSGVLG